MVIPVQQIGAIHLRAVITNPPRTEIVLMTGTPARKTFAQTGSVRTQKQKMATPVLMKETSAQKMCAMRESVLTLLINLRAMTIINARSTTPAKIKRVLFHFQKYAMTATRAQRMPAMSKKAVSLNQILFLMMEQGFRVRKMETSVQTTSVKGRFARMFLFQDATNILPSLAGMVFLLTSGKLGSLCKTLLNN